MGILQYLSIQQACHKLSWHPKEIETRVLVFRCGVVVEEYK